MKRIALLFVALAGLFASPAFAQSTYPTPAGSRVNGIVQLICDTNGANCAPVPGGTFSPSATAAAGTTNARTTVAASSLIAKASAGNLYQYNVTSGASAGYVLIYNSATVPADGTVTPVRCIPLAANTGIEVPLRGSYHSAGIVLAFSTTGCFTQTLSATAFISAEIK
jgi:hypothetical protein